MTELELEHYPEMAHKVVEELGQSAAERFDLASWRIVHRFGRLAVSETIVWVGAVADHRGEAISACELMMDTLKPTHLFGSVSKGPRESNGWRVATVTPSAGRAGNRGRLSEVL